METKFKTKVQILSDFHDDVDRGLAASWEPFVLRWGVSLPLAYAVSYNWCSLKPTGTRMIENCFEDLLMTLNIYEDKGFDSLEDVFKASPNPSL